MPGAGMPPLTSYDAGKVKLIEQILRAKETKMAQGYRGWVLILPWKTYWYSLFRKIGAQYSFMYLEDKAGKMLRLGCLVKIPPKKNALCIMAIKNIRNSVVFCDICKINLFYVNNMLKNN